MRELQLMNTVFDALPVGIVVLDEAARVVLYNQAEEQLAGRRRQDIVGRPFFEEVAPCTNVADLGQNYRQRVADGALDTRLDFRFPRPFLDKPRDVQLVLQGFRVDGRPHGLLVVQDVSAIRSIEHTKDGLVRMLAHDMNNPLTVVMGTLDLLDTAGPGADDRDLRASARHASQRLRDMVTNLFEVTRLHTADVPSHFVRCDVTRLLSGSVELARGLAGPRKVVIRFDAPPGLTIECDADLVRRAVDNLLDNAIRCSPAGGQVLVHVARDGDHVAIRIEDEGPGVPEELRRSLFQAFARGATPGESDHHHGLGLAFVDLVAR
ncbi:MAG: PAS domain-containing protein, partial [Planctomycetes bacterium]|nr:PAS domain-containing protein [Planctomycetota bacterium]